eukprot:scaffold1147_cov68-Phaeocystis_antarctica.AAC.8
MPPPRPCCSGDAATCEHRGRLCIAPARAVSRRPSRAASHARSLLRGLRGTLAGLNPASRGASPPGPSRCGAACIEGSQGTQTGPASYPSESRRSPRTPSPCAD